MGVDRESREMDGCEPRNGWMWTGTCGGFGLNIVEKVGYHRGNRGKTGTWDNLEP